MSVSQSVCQPVLLCLAVQSRLAPTTQFKFESLNLEGRGKFSREFPLILARLPGVNQSAAANAFQWDPRFLNGIEIVGVKILSNF